MLINMNTLLNKYSTNNGILDWQAITIITRLEYSQKFTHLYEHMIEKSIVKIPSSNISEQII